ncbi:acyltransferase [Halosquirtibacter xylanolyticus]|uniref:acyltransferase family protein n=1 Tax=Halosquirtibacter xylanolyticus TaxID=3374599 RepID=UPI00374A9713|nr:acyltransferase [Prolixibacteraceae bacterium]
MKNNRTTYIDNLRILLTCLVIIHHLAITYGAQGLWYYLEPSSNIITTTLLTWLVAINQSFFMGMFFMLSSYFLYFSATKNSSPKVIKDKLIRLGLPLLVYMFALSPIVNGICKIGYGRDVTWRDFVMDIHHLGAGPLWFVVALLLFSIVALIFKESWLSHKNDNHRFHFKNTILIALFTAMISFIIRCIIPLGYSLPILNFQLGHFAQYIVLFYVGLCLAKQNWLDQIQLLSPKKWLIIVLCLIFIFFPLVFVINSLLGGNITSFMGGVNWQSLAFCIWEQLTGFGIIILLIQLFQQKYNHTDALMKTLAQNTYLVYIIHPIILATCSVMLKDIPLTKGLKFIILSPTCIFLTFFLSIQIRRIPIIRKVV